MADLPEIVATYFASKEGAKMLSTFMKPSMKVGGKALASYLKLANFENVKVVLEKAYEKLNDSGKEPCYIPPKTFIPLLEKCSLEDNEQFQDWWSNLLYQAAISNDQEITARTISTFSEISPEEAVFLEAFYKYTMDDLISLARKVPEAHIKEALGRWNVDSIDDVGVLQVYKIPYFNAQKVVEAIYGFSEKITDAEDRKRHLRFSREISSVITNLSTNDIISMIYSQNNVASWQVHPTVDSLNSNKIHFTYSGFKLIGFANGVNVDEISFSDAFRE